jgi:hypothetical protein
MIATANILDSLTQEELRTWHAKVSPDGVLVLKTPHATWEQVFSMWPRLKSCKAVYPYAINEFEIFVVPDPGCTDFGASFPVERTVVFRSPSLDH